MSESRKGRKLSPEHRKKISESNKGKVMSAEARRKISKAQTEAQKGNTNRRSPYYLDARKIFLSIPTSMTVKEQNKLLRQHFPEIAAYTIRRWTRKWRNEQPIQLTLDL